MMNMKMHLSFFQIYTFLKSVLLTATIQYRVLFECMVLFDFLVGQIRDKFTEIQQTGFPRESNHVTQSDTIPHISYGQQTSLIPMLDYAQITYCVYNIAHNNINISNEIS